MEDTNSGTAGSVPQTQANFPVDAGRRERARAVIERTLLIVLGVLLTSAAIQTYLTSPSEQVPYITLGIFGLAFLWLGAFAGKKVRRMVMDVVQSASPWMSLDRVDIILDKWQEDVKVEVEKAEVKDSPLDFATLWRLTQEQINSYHKIATSQANQSFRVCLGAMIVGLILIIAFGITAVQQKDPIAAATAGAISVVSGAVSAYISATFMRAYTEATAQMRQFFLQPADFTRLLGAERLIESIGSDEHKTEAVKIILRSMSFTSPFTPTEQSKGPGKATAKPKRRES